MIEELEQVISECSEYVAELKNCPKGYFLYRGSKYKIEDTRIFESRLENRVPQHMPQNLHKAVNDVFEKKLGWKIRNGVFCYGFTSLDDFPEDLGYGEQFLCFPIGHFTFVYSPEHFDLVGHFQKKDYKISDEYINDLVFKTESLEEAIDSDKYRNGIGKEISVNVPTYYLINPKHRQTLADAIWKQL